MSTHGLRMAASSRVECRGWLDAVDRFLVGIGPEYDRRHMPSLTPLQRSVRATLGRLADETRAPAMQAYMKSTMPYYGVAAPILRGACRELFATLSFDDAEAFRREVLVLWRGAQHREERYVAIRLCEYRKNKPLQTLDALPMYEEMIVTGAWWDYVDELASHHVGALLAAHPRSMSKAMRAWSRSSDMWKRRTSIICQLGFGEATDLDLLFACIEPSLTSKEFFLRKAIGWALRQFARVDPDVVVSYVDKHETVLSGLSRREALKHLREE